MLITNHELIPNQAEKIVLATEVPTQVTLTPMTTGILPTAAGKPAVVRRQLTGDLTARCRSIALKFKLKAVRIAAAMVVLAVYGHCTVERGYPLPALRATQVFTPFLSSTRVLQQIVFLITLGTGVEI